MRSRAANVLTILLLTASMLSAHISACACDHHKENIREPAAAGCHGHHEAESTAGPGRGSEMTQGCVCRAGDASPVITPARPFDKQFTTDQAAAAAAALDIAGPRFSTLSVPASRPASEAQFSSTFHPLLPSRAPPCA